MAKVLLPIGITSAAVTAIFLEAAMPSGPFRIGGVADVIFLFFNFVTVVGFSAVGILFLQPIVWLIRRWRVPIGLALATVTVAGADVGWLMLSWVAKDAWIGGAAGGATAAVWFGFNWDSFGSHTEA